MLATIHCKNVDAIPRDLSKFGSMDFNRLSNSKLLVAVPDYRTYNKIIKYYSNDKSVSVKKVSEMSEYGFDFWMKIGAIICVSCSVLSVIITKYL